MVNKRSPLADRLWSRVKQEGDCWIWQGTNTKGYGMISDKGKMKLTHRVAYTLTHGDIPEGYDILHICDTPSCINPDHLMLGTHQDNMDDMRVKGRAVHVNGEQHPMAKLNWNLVRSIRSEFEQGQSQMDLSKKYCVHVSTVHLIVHNKIWKEQV